MDREMNESKRDRIIDNVTAFVNSLLGVSGVAAGVLFPSSVPVVAAIQIGAYFPQIVAVAAKESVNSGELTEKLNEQIKQCANATAKEYIAKLKHGNQTLYNLFKSVWNNEEIISTELTMDSMLTIIKRKLSEEAKWEGYEITNKDVEKMANDYLKYFFINLKDYKELNQLLLFGTIRDVGNIHHEMGVMEKRVDCLENRTLTKTPDYEQNPLLRTKEFKNRWKSELFLDINNSSNNKVSLESIYKKIEDFLMPEYEDSYGVSNTLGKILTDDSSLINGLVIIGPPGIGKSTLITWTCNSLDITSLLVYSLSDIFQEIDGKTSNSPKEGLKYILERTELSSEDLRGKTMILDGLDEVSEISDKKKYIINLIKSCKRFECKLVITCRENYIRSLDELERKNIRIIQLRQWNKEQIKKYTGLYSNATKKYYSKELISSLCRKESLYGNPLILYMVLALDIQIQDAQNETDVYDKIFSLEGGIFDKPYEMTGEIPLDIRMEVLDISREMAFYMFEYNTDKIDKPFEQFPKLAKRDYYQDYFKVIHHTKGTNSLQFVHRSMYEYFAVDYLVDKVRSLLNESLPLNNYAKLSEVLANYCKCGQIEGAIHNSNPENTSSLIAIFIRTKLAKLFQEMNFSNKNYKKNLYNWWECNTANVIHYGIVASAYRFKCLYKDFSIHQETNGFLNILYLLRIVNNILIDDKEVKVLSYARNEKSISISNQLSDYFRLASNNYGFKDYSMLDLHSINFKGVDLVNSIFDYSNLKDADFGKGGNFVAGAWGDLRGAQFRYAYLKGAHFEGADLRSADFSFANLQAAHLERTKLKGTIFNKADLNSAYFSKSIPDFAGKIEEEIPYNELRKGVFQHLRIDGKNVSRTDFLRSLRERRCRGGGQVELE